MLDFVKHDMVNWSFWEKTNSKKLVREIQGFYKKDFSITRFTAIDPMTEANHRQSGFVYADNNPIRYIDFMGLDAMSLFQNAWDATPEGGSATFNSEGDCTCGCSGKPPCPPEYFGNLGGDIKNSFVYAYEAMKWMLGETAERAGPAIDEEVFGGAIQDARNGDKGKLSTPDLNPNQFKKVTGTIYSKSNTSHGNVDNSGTQWKAWTKGIKEFGNASKSSGDRVTIDGNGSVVGN